jgi:hypothetical protein|eukprot:COSAG06_NODE_6101_length_3109_cov_1.789701_2_plen_67_part_00
MELFESPIALVVGAEGEVFEAEEELARDSNAVPSVLPPEHRPAAWWPGRGRSILGTVSLHHSIVWP